MSLGAWYLTWEIIAAVGTVAVFAGVFLEYGLGVFSALRFWGLHPAHIEVETRTKRFGSMLVVLGLAVELLGGVGVIVTSSRIETQHRAEIAELYKRYAPRRLSEDQRIAIVDKLKRFAGQRINVFEYRETEPWIFGDQIQLALGAPDGAGWIVHTATGQELNRAFEGIVVELKANADARSRDAAKSLVSALSAEQIVVDGPKPEWEKLQVEGFGEVDKEASIRLTIGAKPSGVPIGVPRRLNP